MDRTNRENKSAKRLVNTSKGIVRWYKWIIRSKLTISKKHSMNTRRKSRSVTKKWLNRYCFRRITMNSTMISLISRMQWIKTLFRTSTTWTQTTKRLNRELTLHWKIDELSNYRSFRMKRLTNQYSTWTRARIQTSNNNCHPSSRKKKGLAIKNTWGRNRIKFTKRRGRRTSKT